MNSLHLNKTSDREKFLPFFFMRSVGSRNDPTTNKKSTRDGKELETKEMKTKPLTSLLALTFLQG
jgi:hypothetical protein